MNRNQFDNFENANWLVEPVIIAPSGYERPPGYIGDLIGQDRSVHTDNTEAGQNAL